MFTCPWHDKQQLTLKTSLCYSRSGERDWVRSQSVKSTSLAHLFFSYFTCSHCTREVVPTDSVSSGRPLTMDATLLFYSSFWWRISQIINFLKRGMWHCKVRSRCYSYIVCYLFICIFKLDFHTWFHTNSLICCNVPRKAGISEYTPV